MDEVQQFARDLINKDVDGLIRSAKIESESRILGKGLAHN